MDSRLGEEHNQSLSDAVRPAWLIRYFGGMTDSIAEQVNWSQMKVSLEAKLKYAVLTW